MISPRTPTHRRHATTRLPDRFDPYLVDECTFTRDEICRARGLSVAH